MAPKTNTPPSIVCSPPPQVVVPRTYAEYTSRRVLTTQWLEGEKLSQSQANDVGRLVNVSAGQTSPGALLALRGRADVAADGFAHLADSRQSEHLQLPCMGRQGWPCTMAAQQCCRCIANFANAVAMCSQWLQVGVICYLKQLLDTGFFHAGASISSCFIAGVFWCFAPASVVHWRACLLDSRVFHAGRRPAGLQLRHTAACHGQTVSLTHSSLACQPLTRPEPPPPCAQMLSHHPLPPPGLPLCSPFPHMPSQNALPRCSSAPYQTRTPAT